VLLVEKIYPIIFRFAIEMSHNKHKNWKCSWNPFHSDRSIIWKMFFFLKDTNLLVCLRIFFSFFFQHLIFFSLKILGLYLHIYDAHWMSSIVVMMHIGCRVQSLWCTLNVEYSRYDAHWMSSTVVMMYIECRVSPLWCTLNAKNSRYDAH